VSVVLSKASLGRHFTGGSGGGGATTVNVSGPVTVSLQPAEVTVRPTAAEITVTVFPTSIVAGS
jgi:hypothetical protein